MSYELRDHTADVAVEATAPTLSGVFEAVAEGFTAASCESVPETGERFAVEVSAEGREALLFDYLDQLVYERDVRSVLPAEHRCTVHEPTGDGTGAAGNDDGATGDGAGATGNDDGAVADPDGWRVTGSARGVPLSDVAAREIKAVTYSEMALEERDGGWYAYVVFDV
ncbi:archease [Halorubrum sp. JWXQ-INN 858]|uniref:archease n=1 Tax=Halorubrum sp. JWXQ-INN 858 TaxID=2690782 RepID=UPI0013FBF2C4|nr:archease [Halorubrum sp. JWXQ-INN 858]MWV63805.1 archease [Halorubrum sp. JWXQ-INN 858]